MSIHYLKVKKGFDLKKSGVTEIDWIKCEFSAILIRHCCHATNVTFYLSTVLDALNVIQCITLVSFFSEMSIDLFFFTLKFAFFSLLRNRWEPH